MKNYHAHVYFNPQDLSLIKEVYEDAVKNNQMMKAFRIISHPVGPHPKGMFEIHFKESTKSEVIHWLQEYRQGLSVLIHEDSGDDHRDHTENVCWLGERLPLDFSFFDLVKADPSKALHK